ncbi:MAG TPA: tetratricopeptide repeat protein [Blastocatellia bacterium]|nr:tetratricopeptide repeat protein [Blastocatellia bacterium]
MSTKNRDLRASTSAVEKGRVGTRREEEDRVPSALRYRKQSSTEQSLDNGFVGNRQRIKVRVGILFVLLMACELSSGGQNRAALSRDGPAAQPYDVKASQRQGGLLELDRAPSGNSQQRFAPSNSGTLDGGYINATDFFSASRCAGCHHDTHAMWSASLHRNAAREPFYRESVDILLRTRGLEPTRHCESCHTPVALFSGALMGESPKKSAPFTSLDDEGVTCTVCHSIVEARLDGSGSYTIRRPALLAQADGTPIYGNFTDEQILADIPGHKRAVMRPLLRTSEFCATCHKVTAPPDLNLYKEIKGFTAYDEWQQSGASLETALPYYRRQARAECRTCHMPKVESLNDRAAKNGMIASHQWLGANTAVPLFYNQSQQAAAIEDFLKSKVLDVDIFSIKRAATGAQFAPLESTVPNVIPAKPGEEIIVEVVISNRTAAHTFPPEVRDLYEAWVQFDALDDKGNQVFESGLIKPDGMLDPRAHVYRTILLDQEGRVITRHQIWRTSVKVYDNAVPPGRSDVVRYQFRIPVSARKAGEVSLTLRARVNYRRFNQEYTDFISSRRGVPLQAPIVEMARAESKVIFEPGGQDDRGAYETGADMLPGSATGNSERPVPLGPTGSLNLANALGHSASEERASESVSNVTRPELAARDVRGVWGAKAAAGKKEDAARRSSMSPVEQARRRGLAQRWNDYGIGLFEQAQYGAAVAAFLRASAAAPLDANPLVSAASAVLKMERFGEERIQFAKAAELTTKAIELDPENPRARFYAAWVLRAQGKAKEAVEIWTKLAEEYPRDREVQRQLGETLFQMGESERARSAFEAVISVDPQDAGAYQYLASIYSALGREADSKRAMSLYRQWRDDPMALSVANRFYMAHPEWSDERIPSHVHGEGGPGRAVAAGTIASPY